MRILSIETSCDETAIAILDISGDTLNPNIKVLANSLFSQAKMHAEYGGVYPNLAKREHEKNLPIILAQTLEKAGESTDSPNIDYIAVTKGPGLEPALWTGIKFAEELSQKWLKPIIPVDHMKGHIWSVLYEQKEPLLLPALALLVSGGHTELVLVSDTCKYKVLGRTLDDAVGEAFDKVARTLGLPYPGGPEISKLAKESRSLNEENPYKLPRPMINSGDLNFSFSGLKTAVLYKVKELDIKDEKVVKQMSEAFEDSAVDVLVEKTKKALESDLDVKTLIVSGGVSANQYLRSSMEKMVEEFLDKNLLLPDPSLSTDNAIMIAISAFIETRNPTFAGGASQPIKAQGNLNIEN